MKDLPESTVSGRSKCTRKCEEDEKKYLYKLLGRALTANSYNFFLLLSPCIEP